MLHVILPVQVWCDNGVLCDGQNVLLLRRYAQTGVVDILSFRLS